jgi:predicted transglutaminase-like cysteine proteinase
MRRLLSIVALALTCAAGHPAQAFELSEDVSAARQYPGLSEKWRTIQSRMGEDAERLAFCRLDSNSCTVPDNRLRSIIASAAVREGRARIGEINRAINLAIRPASDLRRFGIADRWTTPLETMRSGMGDCEDYAILKLLALREAGFAADDLQLLIVRDRAARNDHAVAAVRLDGRWLVLDNRGFTLVELEHMRYRLLAQLAPDADGIDYAGLGDASSFM